MGVFTWNIILIITITILLIIIILIITIIILLKPVILIAITTGISSNIIFSHLILLNFH